MSTTILTPYNMWSNLRLYMLLVVLIFNSNHTILIIIMGRKILIKNDTMSRSFFIYCNSMQFIRNGFTHEKDCIYLIIFVSCPSNEIMQVKRSSIVSSQKPNISLFRNCTYPPGVATSFSILPIFIGLIIRVSRLKRVRTLKIEPDAFCIIICSNNIRIVLTYGIIGSSHHFMFFGDTEMKCISMVYVNIFIIIDLIDIYIYIY
uniref:7TM_GPCR_Srx domain-containing protein n=1 Tax=Heterorhabditis bacteriophora TaxID=37862 RepID=A0A1I7WM85_HETBA